MHQPILATMWIPSFDELTRFAPLFTLVATIVALLLGAIAVGRNRDVSTAIATIGALATGFLAWRALSAPAENWTGFDPTGSGPMLVADRFSHFVILLVSVFLILVTGMWRLGQSSDLPDTEVARQDPVEFFVLLVGSAFGMSLMVSTTNLLMIILAVEMASLPSYGITAFRKQNRVAAEASLKYVLFGAITSATMIYGASLLYGYYGSLDLFTIGQAIAAEMQGSQTPSVFMAVAMFAFLVGIAFKVSAVPFHFWCPDVFQGASIEVTTWLSVASKAAGLGLMLRVVTVLVSSPQYYSPETLGYVAQAIAVMAALTCTVGNLSAFRQMNLKRLLAFSSIAHAGYMLMAVAILWRPDGGGVGLSHPAFSSVTSYIMVYLVMNAGAFGVVAMVYWATGSESITAMNGLIRRNPVLAVSMAIILFSLVGLPPLGGFIAKYYLLAAVMKGGLAWLVVVAVLNTLISLYYYARIAKAMIFEDDGLPLMPAPLSGQFAVVVCAVIILVTGTIGPSWLLNAGDATALNLYSVVQPDSSDTPSGIAQAKPAASAMVVPAEQAPARN